MLRQNIYIKYILGILLCLLVFISCRNEDTITDTDNKTNLVFQLTENDENHIETLDILAFKVDANDDTKEYFAYRTQGYSVVDNEVPNKKKFSAAIQKNNEYKFRLVVLANARSEIDNLAALLNSTSLKSDILDKIIAHNSEKWSTNTTDQNYKNIPMWGESPQMIINDKTNTITEITLIRMLARIDISINTPIQNKFKLKSVRVYNYNTSGNVVPMTDTEHWNGSKVLKPTIPSNNGNKFGPLVYDQLSIADVSISNQIYLFETVNSTSTENASKTCLIIGGEYNNEGSETYYKVEFVNSTAKESLIYLNILRNHLYRIIISEVKRSGYTTPEQAFNSINQSITADIIVWEEGELTDVVYDGQYMLGVSRNNISLPMNARTAENLDNQFMLITNNPDGWVVESIVDVEGSAANASWMTLDKYRGSPNTKEIVNVLSKENDTEVDRTAYIHIKAGMLKCIVSVTQTTVPELDLRIRNSRGEEIRDLLFYSHIGSSVPPQQFSISWLPLMSDIEVSLVTIVGAKPFDFGTGDVLKPGLISGANGNITYNIQPPPMNQSEIDTNPFLEKVYKIDFNVTNNVFHESKTIFLIQKNYAAVPETNINYLMDGSQQYFGLVSNAPWKIEVTDDPQNVIKQLVTSVGGLYEDKRDEKVYFTTNDYTNNPAYTKAEVTFTLKSTNAERYFPDKTFTLMFYAGEKQPLSNSYILAPSSRPIVIPVSRANQAVAGSLADNALLKGELVWTDNPNRIAPNSNIREITALGRGGSGYLHITPGSGSGNAVVAVKENENIKWSWHLWITSYNPNVDNKTLNGFTLMDRNLGASANNNNAGAIGLLYQWGRKDPFPGANNNGTSNIGVAIYNTTGSTPPVLESATNSGTLLNSIKNPLTFYFLNANWVGSAGTGSWSEGGKTIYDPCPPGWMVPSPAVWSGLNTGNFVWSNYGRTHSTAGWFPAAGLRGSSIGDLTQVGQSGEYWTTAFQILIYFYSSSVTVNGSFSAANGFSVRCMKE